MKLKSHFAIVLFLAISNLTSAQAPVAEFIASDSAICFNTCIDFTDLSTNSPTAWSWSFPGGTPATSVTQNPTNICYNTPGFYDVTLTATNGFGLDSETKTGYIFVGNAPGLSTSSTPASCFGNDGSATAIPTGGVPPFFYTWSNASTTSTITGLTAGIYGITLTDFVGCSAFSSATVTQQQFSVVVTTIATTCDSCDGTATVNIAGGNPPYTYQWDANALFQTTQTATGLCPCSPSVTVTDMNSCNGSGQEEVFDLCNIDVITGYVFEDINVDCVFDSTEVPMIGRFVKAEPGPSYGYTDSSGFYKIYVDTGTYTVSQVITSPYISQICPVSPSTYDVTFTNLADTSSGHNYGNQIIAYCPNLNVSISSWLLRPCSVNVYTVSYYNDGTDTAFNATVVVELDSHMTYLTSTGILIMQNGKQFTFDIGDMVPGQSGMFLISIIVECNLDVAGKTLCVEAHIYPDSSCFPPDTIWDKSSVAVEGGCIGDSMACFTIYNTGDPGNGDMQGTSEYRIYENNILVYTGTFQIAGGDSIVICWPANGNTIRLEADQRPGHPGNSQPQDHVEDCGGPPIILNQIILVPQDDNDDFVDIDCGLVIISYDPNDKSVQPQGLTAQYHYIDSTDALEYRIRFQNTGTDTAFTVVITDTLSQYLDVTSIQPGASSHPYSLDISGTGILEWTFSPILLPDSNTNEPGSHGFVKFKIDQKQGNPKGTVIENYAGIVFDINVPVITDTVFNTIGNIDSLTINVPVIYNNEFNIKVYPNPYHTTTTIMVTGLDEDEQLSFALYDVVGRKVKEIENIRVNRFEVDRSNLPNGIYLYRIASGEALIGVGKLMVQ